MATTGEKGASPSASGDEGRDSTPPSLAGHPVPSFPSISPRFVQTKGYWGGLLLGWPWGGGDTTFAPFLPCSRSHIPIPSQCNGRRGGYLQKKPPRPFLGHKWPLLGTGQVPCAGSPAPRCRQGAGMRRRGRQSWQGQASRLDVSGLKGQSSVVLVPVLPGTAGSCRPWQGCQGGAGPPELSAELLLSWL